MVAKAGRARVKVGRAGSAKYRVQAQEIMGRRKSWVGFGNAEVVSTEFKLRNHGWGYECKSTRHLHPVSLQNSKEASASNASQGSEL